VQQVYGDKNPTQSDLHHPNSNDNNPITILEEDEEVVEAVVVAEEVEEVEIETVIIEVEEMDVVVAEEVEEVEMEAGGTRTNKMEEIGEIMMEKVVQGEDLSVIKMVEMMEGVITMMVDGNVVKSCH